MLNKIKAVLLRWVYQLMNRYIWSKHSAPTVQQSDAVADGVPIRIYRPVQTATGPVVIYFHGGGWVLGNIGTHEAYCQRLCHSSSCVVISVDYRLAPEHPYPAAALDCLAATRWIAANREALQLGDAPLVLAGDSAGGNLAAITAQHTAQDETINVVGQLLIYPVLSHYRNDSASYREKATGYALTRSLMLWFWDTYLADSDPERAELAIPALGDITAQLPGALVITAEHDPLRDEGIDYAATLQRAGVEVSHRHFANAEHGFACSSGPTEDFQSAMTVVCEWLGQWSQASSQSDEYTQQQDAQ